MDLWSFLGAYWLIVGIPSALIGALICHYKNAWSAGFLLGLIFGPIGALAVFTLDRKCPKCRGYLNGKPAVCPHCRSVLEWGRRRQMVDGPSRPNRKSAIHEDDENLALAMLESASDTGQPDPRKTAADGRSKLLPCPDCGG